MSFFFYLSKKKVLKIETKLSRFDAAINVMKASVIAGKVPADHMMPRAMANARMAVAQMKFAAEVQNLVLSLYTEHTYMLYSF